MLIMSIRPTWHQGISTQTYMVTHEYLVNMMTKGSQSKHGNKYISHQQQNKIPHQTSNMDLYRTMHPKQRGKEVHDHTTYTSHQGVI